MRIFKKITDRRYWISTGVIVFSVMLFKGLLGSFISRQLGLGTGVIIEFLSVSILILLSRLISEEVLEI